MVPRSNVPLAPFSTLGIGGAARWFVRAERADDVAAADAWCAERGVQMFVLGGGSNLVIADEGFSGLVLLIGMRGTSDIADDDEIVVTARAGEPWDDFVASVVGQGFAGLECLSGIPGTIGGTPIQNVGAYGQEVAGTIESVGVFDRQDRSFRRLAAADCGFSYRMSRFKGDDSGRFVVCEVAFRLRRGAPNTTYPDVIAYLNAEPNRAQRDAHNRSPGVVDVREAVLAVRRSKGMVIDALDPDTRSVGSFFMNPVVTTGVRETIASIGHAAPPGYVMPDGRVKIPAAWLIERSGFLKGYRLERAGISTKHPLALVNLGGAAARNVVGLATRIKRAVADRFGVWLVPEPMFVGFEDNPELDYLQRANH